MNIWKKLDSIFEGFKKFPLFKILYKLSWAPRAYHFGIALVGAVLYPRAGRGMFVIGVTGTKGKTTTLEILNSVLEAAGKKTAVLSSVRLKIADKQEKKEIDNTMPGRFFMQDFLRRAAKARCEYALLEVTSQGVELSRHRFIKWGAAILTNLAPEHIESHGTFNKYRAAKFAFLKMVARQGGKIFLNQMDAGSDYFWENLPSGQIIQFSHAVIPELRPEVYEILPGNFSKDNIVAAVSAARFLKISEDAIRSGIENFKGVPGRAEFVQREPFAVVVDYAHTPDSLDAIYSTLRVKMQSDTPIGRASSHSGRAGSRLICVLGSAGGGRDKWKRPLFGKIASQYCDKIFLTNEDPWDEGPGQILNEIESGITDNKYSTINIQQPITKILDRKEAIKRAVNSARAGDTVVITGKGSETAIRIANSQKIPWSDRAAAEEAIKQKLAGSLADERS